MLVDFVRVRVFIEQMEKERLQGQVVNSPQRILREVEDQQQALEQVRFRATRNQRLPE